MKKFKSIVNFFLLILFTKTSFAQVPQYVPASGLQAWYNFSGVSTDASGNLNHATNSGATYIADRNGNPSSAADFDGTSSFMVVNTPSFTLSPSTSFSYSFWIKKRTQIGTSAGIVLMTGVNTTGVFITLIQGISNFMFGTNKQQSSWFWVNSAHTLNVWDHYVTTFNAGSMKVYKNGILQGTTTYTHTGATAVNIPLYIGRGFSGASYFNGSIDDIGIWNRELNQSEINALYSSLTGISEAVEIQKLVYPNPVSEYLVFQSDREDLGKSYRVYDVSGKLILNGLITDLNTLINTANFSPGTYKIVIGDDRRKLLSFLKN